jgi:transposase InsO family protein
MTEAERWHAKLGDVGVKTLHRVLPELRIPKNLRCEYCIQGKMHNLGHKSDASGERVQYAPGENLHTDLAGPYAKSLSGHRYSMLFLDLGSKFLWSRGLAAKSDYFAALKAVMSDCEAASGRKLRFLQTDGDGIFRSEELAEFLQGKNVRHLWSSPYDSDTNPFIERERRTVLEGTSTSLLRSGAPSVFWREAEAHKIFSINVLPVLSRKGPPYDQGKKNYLRPNKVRTARL